MQLRPRWIVAAVIVGLAGTAAASRHGRSGRAVAGTHEFQQLLDARNEASVKNPAAVPGIDQRIRERFERPVAVMVTDMAGFTSRTKANGVIDTLSTIRRMQQVGATVIARHGGKLVKADADDLFVTHESPGKLLELARDLVSTLKHEKAFGPDGLSISAGLSYGPALLIGDEELFGDAVNVASKLGEDLAEPTEILATPEFERALAGQTAVATSCTPATNPKGRLPYLRCQP